MTVYIIPKMSKYELDMTRRGLSHDGIIEAYLREGIDHEKMLASHEKQYKSFGVVKSTIPDGVVLKREDLVNLEVTHDDFLVSHGGDNHFQYVSHYARDARIIGVNSDPDRSEGALTNFVAEDLCDLIGRLNDATVENWPRLDASLNGNQLPFAVSEYFLGELNRMDMSRYVIEDKGISKEQKSSGLIVSTGAGSTGWYMSAGGRPFSRNDEIARYIATEIYQGKHTDRMLSNEFFYKDDEIVVTSLNDSNGVISVDSLERYSFPMGSSAVIRIASKPLKVIANY